MKSSHLGAAIGLALVAVAFLVPQVVRAINGEPGGFTPGVATAIGLFMGAAVNFVLWLNSRGRSGSPTT
jgi:hypothetical protein